jgi:hypothetical protein
MSDLWKGVPVEEEIKAGGRAGWRCHPGRASGPLPDVSPGFFSLSVRY